MRPEVFSGGFYSPTGIFSIPSAPGGSASTPTSVPEKKTPAALRARSVRTEIITEPRAFPVIESASKPNGVPDVPLPAGRRFVEATVNADVLPVYATNSARSRVLKLLSKGDLVQTDLAVIDSVGHWSLITVPGQRISGYVRTEDIEMTRTASKN
jgi:hypothetical protein